MVQTSGQLAPPIFFNSESRDWFSNLLITPIFLDYVSRECLILLTPSNISSDQDLETTVSHAHIVRAVLRVTYYLL
jgi:hypothetical protein